VKTFYKGVAGAAVVMFALAGCGGGDDDDDVSGGAAARCDTYSVATLDDDSHRTAFYAIDKGHVKSSVIGRLRVDYLQIPALIQATGAGQYDVVQTSLPGLVQAREQGRQDLRVVGIVLAHTGGGMKTYVRSDSNIRSGRDLKGKTVGVFSFGSTATLQSQLVYAKKYGLDSKLEGGDVKWVELDPPTLLNALDKGDVDAAVLFHQVGWQAAKSGKYRVVVRNDVEFREISGAWPIGSALTIEPDQLKKKPACVREFQRMMRESGDMPYPRESGAAGFRERREQIVDLFGASDAVAEIAEDSHV
jgi:ABC-type nitrate/sulfonate/bicarbonate transport system substrate-binding protein